MHNADRHQRAFGNVNGSARAIAYMRVTFTILSRILSHWLYHVYHYELCQDRSGSTVRYHCRVTELNGRSTKTLSRRRDLIREESTAVTEIVLASSVLIRSLLTDELDQR